MLRHDIFQRFDSATQQRLPDHAAGGHDIGGSEPIANIKLDTPQTQCVFRVTASWHRKLRLRYQRPSLTIDKLEAMTCVCSVGLDMIAVPGSTTAETISAIIADEAAVGMVNSKTTAVRVIPVEGADVGDTVEMGGLLGSAPVMPVHEASSADFIARGGRIPAPLHSLRN